MLSVGSLCFSLCRNYKAKRCVCLVDSKYFWEGQEEGQGGQKEARRRPEVKNYRCTRLRHSSGFSILPALLSGPGLLRMYNARLLGTPGADGKGRSRDREAISEFPPNTCELDLKHVAT